MHRRWGGPRILWSAGDALEAWLDSRVRNDIHWDTAQPIYRQLRDRVVARILEGLLKEGDALPSVRHVAAEFGLNPLTVLKGYQQLVDQQLVEKRRGRGMYVSAGAAAAL